MTVVGVDIGGTSTRALAVDLDGTLVGRGEAAGANPNSHPPEVASVRVAEAVAAALGQLDPAGAKHCVLGMAGVSKLSDPAVAEAFHGNLARIGLRCPVTSLSDAEVAFASATPSPDGTVLVAGTGSVAARIVNHRKTITAGGYGWLLGDEGSAFWIGREAVRTTLRTLRSDEAISPLAGAVLAEAIGERGTPENREHSHARLITSANSEPPIRLARFAALVSAAAPADPQAMKIVDAAADLLAQQAFAVRTPGERTPIVLVGSVVGEGSPVGGALRERLDAPVESATDGAAGAAWLAAIEVLGPGAPRPR